jgi:hypothetical protein
MDTNQLLDHIRAELRPLATRLVEDNDDHPDDVAEQACRLARHVLELDTLLSLAGSPPSRASWPSLPIDTLIRVADYLYENEATDYRESARDIRQRHIYRDAVTLRRWLRQFHRRAL